ncbi:hypothetical protein DPMN_060729 [Dreissena polymorpha]|uniref:Uncharacterized protein n=1 Tax=Dreissena polymorpha TaxID=45954 RepID=A0A9D4HHP0_DREPO|nr:hypothetical protein DPMN_060625 [Dreissena polymorpha]KAH3717933.1 hypothetical protein DPMN_060729 [Dreissena polymorpha]
MSINPSDMPSTLALPDTGASSRSLNLSVGSGAESCVTLTTICFSRSPSAKVTVPDTGVKSSPT